MADIPKIYTSIAAVIADVGPVRKDMQTDYGQRYRYRGIDGLMNKLNPVLGKHKLVILPKIASAEYETRATKQGTTQYVRLTVHYTIYAEDGSSLETDIIGEAMDSADKLLNKAMTAAYKCLCFQLFCIPTDGEMIDSERDDHQPAPPQQPQPVQRAPQPQQTPAPQPQERFITQEEWNEVMAICRNAGVSSSAEAKKAGYTKVSEIPASFLNIIKSRYGGNQ